MSGYNLMQTQINIWNQWFYGFSGHRCVRYSLVIWSGRTERAFRGSFARASLQFFLSDLGDPAAYESM